MSSTNSNGNGNATQAQLFKLRKVLDDTAVEELEAQDRESLTATIARCEDNVREQEQARADCTELTAAKERVKEIDGPFKDAIKYQRAKQRYAAILREQAGGGQ